MLDMVILFFSMTRQP